MHEKPNMNPQLSYHGSSTTLYIWNSTLGASCAAVDDPTIMPPTNPWQIGRTISKAVMSNFRSKHYVTT